MIQERWIAIISLAGFVAGMCALPAAGQLDFSDDFEPNGVDGNVWTKWPEADEMQFSDDTVNHTDDPDATWSVRAEEADPWGYAMYADFGATTGPIYAEVWIYDQYDDDGLDFDRPVSAMLALVGGTPQTSAWVYTDYLQLGICAWYDPNGLTDTYSFRTAYRESQDGGFVDTQMPRKEGWTKLAIAAEALADGGEVRFYVDDLLVGTSQRLAGEPLQYVRLGLNFKTYDYIWYDDLVITDNIPASNALPYDVDRDGDVDHQDFAVFQRCFTGPDDLLGELSTGVCQLFDGDEDADVDEEDFVLFDACVSGPEVPADPTCDDVQ